MALIPFHPYKWAKITPSETKPCGDKCKFWYGVSAVDIKSHKYRMKLWQVSERAGVFLNLLTLDQRVAVKKKTLSSVI